MTLDDLYRLYHAVWAWFEDRRLYREYVWEHLSDFEKVFSGYGAPIRSYPIPTLSYIALTSDGRRAYVDAVVDERIVINRRIADSEK